MPMPLIAARPPRILSLASPMLDLNLAMQKPAIIRKISLIFPWRKPLIAKCKCGMKKVLSLKKQQQQKFHGSHKDNQTLIKQASPSWMSRMRPTMTISSLLILTIGNVEISLLRLPKTINLGMESLMYPTLTKKTLFGKLHLPNSEVFTNGP